MSLAEVEAKLRADNELQTLLGGTELVSNHKFVLKHLDSGDGDGKITRDEFAERLLPLIEGTAKGVSKPKKPKTATTPQGKLHELFEDIDTDGSGQVRHTCLTTDPHTASQPFSI